MKKIYALIFLSTVLRAGIAQCGMTIIPHQVNITCSGLNDGSASVNVSGGVGSYTYNWKNASGSSTGTTSTVTGLSTGNYTVYVTDATPCKDSVMFTITEPNPLTVSVSGTNLNCFNDNSGTAAAIYTGGTPPYTFFWQPSLYNVFNPTGLTAGSHTVTITDSFNCTNTASIILSEPTQLVTAITNIVPITCNGICDGDATMLVNGGTQAYSYTWTDPSMQISASAVALCAGTYTCTVTDANGCTSSQTVSIAEPSPITITGAPGVVNISCNGGNDGSITVSVAGGNASYTYSWSPGTNSLGQSLNGPAATDLIANSYSLTVIDLKGCIDFASYSITEPAALNLSLTTMPCSVAGNDGTIAANNTTGGIPAYTWSLDGGVYSNATSYFGLSAGTHTVCVQDQKACVACTTTIVTSTTGIVENNNSNENLLVYPNPANDFLMLQYEAKEEGTTKIELFNLMGELIKSQQLSNKQKGKNLERLDVNGLSNGIYLVKMSGNSQQQVQKLVIQK